MPDTDAATLLSLDRLKPGETAEIVRLDGVRHGYLQRLTNFGLAPGRFVRLRQRHPALVLQLGETELALDRGAGREIFVRRATAGAPATMTGIIDETPRAR